MPDTDPTLTEVAKILADTKRKVADMQGSILPSLEAAFNAFKAANPNLPEHEWDAVLHPLGLARKLLNGRWGFAPYLPRLMENIGSAVVVYCPATDEVLYEVRRDNNMLGHLGGGCKPGEALLDAAKREFTEESRLTQAMFTPIAFFGFGQAGTAKNPHTVYPDGEQRVHRGMVWAAAVEAPATLRQAQASIESKSLHIFKVGEVDEKKLFPHGQMIWRLFRQWHALQGNPEYTLLLELARKFRVTPLLLN